MEAKDMGYDVVGGTHDPNYTFLETALIQALGDYIGADHKISAPNLAWVWAWPRDAERVHLPNVKELEKAKRDLRYMVNHLVIDHDQPILSKAGYQGGYWLADGEGEATEFYFRFRRRAMTGLTKAARGKKAALADMVTQLSFEFDEILQNSPQPAKYLPKFEWPTAAEIVTRTLDRMTADPERYAEALQHIHRKFKSVLMPKEKARALKETVARLGYLLKDLDAEI